MISLERSRDWELIRRIATDPKVYPAISDDASPKVADWQPVDHPDIWYVIVRADAEPLGMWMLARRNAVCWEIHTALLPIAYGLCARTAAADLGPWIWAQLPECQRVITEVPAYNRLARKFAIDSGMTQWGVNPGAYLKNGKLYDIIMLGISRPERN